MESFTGSLTRKIDRWSLLIVTIMVGLGIAMCSSITLAQSGVGSIQGTVTDPTGAAIPSATVHVVKQDTNEATDTKTNGVGFYEAPGLFAGTYEVSVIAPGMKTYTATIELLVSQNAVINAVLTPGAVTQQVLVSANTAQLTTTDSGSITSTLENERINQLPMNGRNVMTLLQETTPGMTYGGERANALPFEATEYISDGVPNSSSEDAGAVLTIQQDPDAVQEVSVESLDAGAQYAIPTAVVLTTKSGTNTLHGALFETARNNVLGIAKTRQNPANYSAPHLVRNEFGASAGGPIILPHVYHGKDKSFWFFAYERYSLATFTPLLETVPTQGMSQGDFSGLLNSSGVLQQLYDPATTYSSSNCAATPSNPVNPYCRLPFSGNQIPESRISPTAKILFSLYPPPNSSANPLVASNLTANGPDFAVIPNSTFRIDHMFDERNRAYARFTYELENTNISDGAGGRENLAVPGIPAGAAEGYGNAPLGSILAGIGYTHIFSPSFFAETVVSQQWNDYRSIQGTDINVNYDSLLGLPNNYGKVGFPATSGLLNNFSGSQNPLWWLQLTSEADENLTKIVGRHQMQFGVRYRHERFEGQPEEATSSVTFDGLATGVYDPASGANYGANPNTGNSNADMFLGSASNYALGYNPPNLHYHFIEFDGYFQDNYHVSRNLTVNLGVRYEAHPGLWLKYGLDNTFDLKNDAMVLEVPPSTLISEGYTTQAIITNMENIGVKFETPAEAGMPTSLNDNYYLNILPRGGLAFLPFGGKHGMVIRGGYGRYAFPACAGDVDNHFASQAPYAVAYSQSYTAANYAIDGLPDELIRYNDPTQFGVMGVNTANVVNTASVNAIVPGVNLFSVNPKIPPSFVTETNLTIEQPLKGNSALRVSWVWTHATNLDTALHFNNHPSTYQWEMATGTLPPTGGVSVIGTPQQNTYAATAQGPYDQTTWGTGMSYIDKTGWSNDDALQVNYQRLFHHGVAYQVSYVYSKPMRMGGDNIATGGSSNTGTEDSALTDPYADFPGAMGTVATMTSPYGTVYPGVSPPAPPRGTPAWANYHALDRYEGYELDDTQPKLAAIFTGIVDLPFGSGKRFFSNANRFVNELIGGFQLAGDGQVTSQDQQLVTPPTGGNWGAVSPLKIYKHKYPILDCRSGVCEHSYMWFNGYLAPTVLPAPLGTCTTNCVTGLPADYVPYQVPVDNTPGTTYYGTNNVLLTLPNRTQQAVAYDAGPEGADYLYHTMIDGPNNWTIDTSIFKVFPITERANLRFNMDVFNALNIQGWNEPGSLNGVETNLSSYNSPRQVQLTLRLTF
jgi:Carboxypeptidase regulatory-like domain